MVGAVVGLLHGERLGRIPVRTLHRRSHAVDGVLSEVIFLEPDPRGEDPDFCGRYAEHISVRRFAMPFGPNPPVSACARRTDWWICGRPTILLRWRAVRIAMLRSHENGMLSRRSRQTTISENSGHLTRLSRVSHVGVSRMAAGTATASCSIEALRMRCAAVMIAEF